MAHLLIVEDEEQYASHLKQWLTSEGHDTDLALCGEDALRLLDANTYDLIILDWNLPDIEGIEVCRRYRTNGGSSYIIFLTGKGGIADKEEGFDSGSDDYLVKPVDVRELSARIKSMLSRQTVLLPMTMTIDDVTLDSRTRVVTINDESVHLMPKESALLEFLMRHPNTHYSSQALLDSVWPADGEGTCESVRTWMVRLRTKLSEAGKDDFIKTVARSGYFISFEKPDS